MEGRHELGVEPISTHPYHYGFDYLRAFMSLAVVAWHRHLFGMSALFNKNEFSRQAIALSDIINFHFLMLPVPVFFLISIFLFFEHYAEGKHYFSLRIRRIACLYGFWLGLAFLLHGYRYGFSPLLPSSGPDLLMRILSGWSTLYYFFPSLLIMTCIAMLVVHCQRIIVWLLLVISLLSLWGVSLLVRIGVVPQVMVAFWNPLNFVPYVFIARLLSDKTNQISKDFFPIPFLFLLSGVFFTACVEWKYLQSINNFQFNYCYLPTYTRISLVLEAVMVFCLSFLVRHRPYRLIRFLSDYSLGLYCLHMYVILMVYDQIVINYHVQMAPLMAFVAIVSLSLIIAVAFRRLVGKYLI